LRLRRIYLPRFSGQPEAAAAEPTRRMKRGRETILVVEDLPIILRLVTKHLTRLGYAVLATQNPEEAPRLAREAGGALDLLLLDVVMPGMNGRELATKLLALYPKVKCLHMSGYTADVIAHHGILDRSIALLQKPFTAEELSAKVREVLDGGRDD
jgi:two-component system cell cycle sensor histidine kinase/response regulator CckA